MLNSGGLQFYLFCGLEKQKILGSNGNTREILINFSATEGKMYYNNMKED